jgi:excisionase family DNA binding protein
VPEELSNIMARILRIVATGGTVTVGSMPEELTTSTAAEQLGISRPTLMKMIDRGEIPAHKVGSHTRLRTCDVMAFRGERQARRRKAFEELRALEDE